MGREIEGGIRGDEEALQVVALLNGVCSDETWILLEWDSTCGTCYTATTGIVFPFWTGIEPCCGLGVLHTYEASL